MKSPLRRSTVLSALGGLLFAFTGRGLGADMVTVEPPVIEDLLPNPGMGWQTFHRFADEDKELQGLPSASAYFRFYWRELEPRDGEIDFARWDALLAHAHRAGQKLAFRVMCTGSGEYQDVPAWLKDQGCHGVEFLYGGRKHWVPDFADPLFQRAHRRLISELGRRYDGHPDLDLVDIGSVGLWGEWHMSDTKVLGGDERVPLPSVDIRNGLIEAWCRAFPRTPKVVLIGSVEGMERTTRDGLGWRADCLGDMGGFSKTWNHMDHFYRQQLARTGAEESWRNAPVAFESCWDMRKWKQEGWDIRHIFDYALECHASYLNNKSAPLPDGARPEVERFLRRLGYRLVLRKLRHPASVRPGEPLPLVMTWENNGVAPPYRDYYLAVRLRREGTPATSRIAMLADSSIRGWLPGPRETTNRLEFAPALEPGRYELAVGIVERERRTPAVRLAIAGRDAEGWYPLTVLGVGPR